MIALVVAISFSPSSLKQVTLASQQPNTKPQPKVAKIESKTITPSEPAQAPEPAAAVVETAPVQTPVPAPIAYSGGGCSQWTSIISQYDWNITTALAVCNAESGGNPNNNNAGDYHVTCYGSRGLFQIGCDSTANYDGMFDPAANVAQAYALYARRGWQPWGATTCAYKVVCN